MNIPNFTGRNVPIEEISAVSGLTVEQIQDGIMCEEFRFGYAIGIGKGKYDFYCPDKKVWEETGYFNDKFAGGE
ncbi:MAG: hypothetical protein NC452_10005 [Eubacterium sp.]|nr:hypothetical protein [Eubacterium sp.]